MSSKVEPTIRLARREDIPSILAMIKELAHFENADDSVLATEASLSLTLAFAPSPHRHSHEHSDKDRHSHEHSAKDNHAHNDKPPPDAPLSASNPQAFPTQSTGYAKTFLLEAPEDGEVAGMALYFHNYSTWRARPGIYLEDLYVRPAYRRRGYATLLLRELAREVRRIEGGRLEWSCLKWNENALRFYKEVGAERMEEWVGLRVEGEALERLAEREVKAGAEGKET